MPNALQSIRDHFRAHAKTPALRASVYVEECSDHPGFQVWVGQGSYLVPYKLVDEVLSAPSPEDKLQYIPEPHSLLPSYRTLSRLVTVYLGQQGWGRLAGGLMEELWPEEMAGKAAFPLSEEQRIALAVLAYGTIEKALIKAAEVAEPEVRS